MPAAIYVTLLLLTHARTLKYNTKQRTTCGTDDLSTAATSTFITQSATAAGHQRSDMQGSRHNRLLCYNRMMVVGEMGLKAAV